MELFQVDDLSELNDDLLRVLAVAIWEPASAIDAGVEQLHNRVIWVFRGGVYDFEFKFYRCGHLWFIIIMKQNSKFADYLQQKPEFQSL